MSSVLSCLPSDFVVTEVFSRPFLLFEVIVMAVFSRYHFCAVCLLLLHLKGHFSLPFWFFCLLLGLAGGIFSEVQRGTQFNHLNQKLEKAARSPANFSLDIVLSEGIQEF